MDQPTILKAFRLIAALAITSGLPACVSTYSPSVTGGSTETQFPSTTTYPESIPRWGSVDPHEGTPAENKVDVSFNASNDWEHLLPAQLAE